MSEVSCEDEELLRYVFDMLDGNSDGLLEFKDVVSALRRSAEVGALLNARIRIGNTNQETLMRRISKIVYEENQVIDFPKFSQFVKLTDEQASLALLEQMQPSQSNPDPANAPTVGANSTNGNGNIRRSVSGSSTGKGGGSGKPKPGDRHRRVPSFSQLSVVTSPPNSKTRKKNAQGDLAPEGVDKNAGDNDAPPRIPARHSERTEEDDDDELDGDEGLGSNDGNQSFAAPDTPPFNTALSQSRSSSGDGEARSMRTESSLSPSPGYNFPSPRRVDALRGGQSPTVPHSPITAASSPGGEYS